MKQMFRARIENREIKYYNPLRFDWLTENWEGTEIRITFEKLEKVRSPAQNNYYWGVIIATISEAVGYTEDELHYALKDKFLKMWDGKYKLYRIRSTTDLSTIEFEEYIKNVKQWTWEFLRIWLPEPKNEENGKNTVKGDT